MRSIAFELCAIVFAVLFVVTLTATALHRARSGAGGEHSASALAEYFWAVVPWLIVAGSAYPAVRLILEKS